MNVPKLNSLSTASQLSLLAVVILMGAIFVTVNTALEQHSGAGHANVTTYQNISIRSTSHASNGGVAHLTLSTANASTNPIQAGDVLIAQVVVHGAATSITPPSGWSLIKRTNTATSLGSALYKRVASGVDAASYTWTFSAAENASGGMIDFAHVDSMSPVDASSGQYNYSSTSMTAPSVTTTTPADELVFFGAIDATASVTTPTGMTSGWTATTKNTTSFMAHQKLTAGGSTGSKIGKSSISVSNVAQLLALKPSSIIIPPNTPVTTIHPTIAHPTPTGGPTATPTPILTPPNDIKNHSFENGTTDWSLIVNAAAAGTFTTTTTTAEAGAHSGMITVTTSNANGSYIQLKQSNLPMVAAKTYKISFWAKASASRTITSDIRPVGTINAIYAQKSHSLTTSWQKFSYGFTPATSQADVSINFNVANAKGIIYIDNVSYGETLSPVPTPTCIPEPPQCYPGSKLGIVCPAPPAAGWCGAPTPTPSGPSITPIPGHTELNFTVGLQGIGTGGDSANPNSTGNTNPNHPTRTIAVDVYDAQNQLVSSQQGSITYDQATGKFTGLVDLGTGFTTGLYSIKVKSDQYLRAIVPGIQTVTEGQVTTLPLVTLVTGDINNDNAINIEDYNILIGCYSDLLPPKNCPAGENVAADITDDGHVNQYDYNLFLRSLTNIGGQ